MGWERELSVASSRQVTGDRRCCVLAAGDHSAQTQRQGHRAHVHISPMQSITLPQSFPLSWDVEWMGSLLVTMLVVQYSTGTG